MKPYIFRTAIVWTLIVAFIFSCFPASYAIAGISSQQNSKTSSTKRGKNGSSTTPNTTTQPVNRQEDSQPLNGETQPASEKSQSSNSQGSATPQEKRSGNDQKADNDKVPTTFEEALPKQQQSRREPPPFDRPPVNEQSSDNASVSTGRVPEFDRPASNSSGRTTTSQPSTGRTTASQPSTDSQTQRPGVTVQRPEVNTGNTSTRQSTPNYPSQRYPSGGNDTERYPANNPRTTTDDRDPEPTYRSTPPVLKREKDSRNQGTNNGDSRGAPPVLRRSGDNSQSSTTNDRTNQQTSSPTNTRNYPQSGSSPSQQDDGQEETIKLDATLVNIPILVSDRSNRYISSLNAKDFLLYEDGVQQEVAFFGNERVPFTVALLLDMSPSVQGNTEAIQDAAIDFVRQLRSDDRVMVISFDRKIDYLTDFTSDRRILEQAIRSVSTGSGTSVYDAVYETVARKLRNVDGRKALILFSDGEDTTSNKANYDEAINIVTESDVLVYGLRYASDNGGNVQVNPWPRSPIPNIPFPFPWPFPKRRGHFAPSNLTGQPNAAGSATPQWPRRGGRGGRNGDFMADITEAGGGPVFDAQTVGDMRGLANKIAEELRHVYQISYYPTNSLSNGGYRGIRIRVKNRDDISVRHRKGYNAREVARGSKI
jgi:Ca-activated chloride channel family protein